MRNRLIPVINLTLILVIAALLIRGGWTSRQGTREQATVAPTPSFDWSNVSDRDLRIASVFVAARNHGVAAALDTLQAVASRDSSIFAEGHALAHGVGRFVMAHNGANPSALAECRPVFEAGCYHGVLEGYLASVPTVDATKLTSMCGSLMREGESRLPAHECAHGLGHGLLERLSYDLGAALAACDAFAVESLRGECHDGVFMQITVRGLGLSPADSTGAASTEHHHGAMPGMSQSARAVGPFRASDLAFPCDSVGAAYRPSCWAYQPIAIVSLVRMDVEKTLRGCDLAPDGARSRCYAGLGKQSTGWFSENNARVIAMCERAAKGYVDSCLAGAVEAKVDANWTPDGAVAFCRQLPRSRKARCYEMIGERMALVRASDAEVQADCARAEPAFVEVCLRASRRS